MKRKFLFGILVCVFLLTCCISDNGETTTTTPSSKTVKVDPKDLVLDLNEMLYGFTIGDEKYLKEEDRADYEIEHGWQAAYWRQYKSDMNTEVTCSLYPPDRIQDLFNYVKGYQEARVKESSTRRDFSIVSSPSIGDGTFAFQYQYKSGEKWYTTHWLYFIKQNVLVKVWGSQPMSWDDIFDVGNRVANKIPDAPMELSEDVPT
jgi:hypothetical protein